MAKYKHDCNTCQYIGDYTKDKTEYDLYYCPGLLGGSLVARFSDSGADYLSMRFDILLYAGHGQDSPLVRAAQRQLARWTSVEGT